MSQILQILDKFDINGHDKPGGTDKNTNHSYVEVYENLLSRFVDKKGSLLEIGIQYGGSTLLWQEYLKEFKICAIDTINQVDEKIISSINPERVRIKFCDAYLKETFDNVQLLYPNGFDVIIDDGPHTLKYQINCIGMYTELLKVNGILIIEDIQNFDDIEVLRNSIPQSSLYDYEFQVYDLRSKKERYDDVIVTITKKEKNPGNKIAVFYHLGQFGQWQRLFQEQMNSLVISGLYHEADFVYIGVNGEAELPFTLPKFKVVYNNNKILEADTIKALYDFCQLNSDHRVFYFHSKGSTQEDKSFRLNVEGWRLYLEYFTIHKWQDCTKLLSEYDTVGTEYSFETGLVNQQTGNTDWETNPHYAGNYWWANAEYINRLDPNYLYKTDKGWDRYRSEFWIGTGDPKYYNFYHTSIFSKYNEWGVTPLDYVKKNFDESKLGNVMLKNKKAKFVMITMFKNEAKTIRRMLESCYKFIDYYVIQDNGSTDGTPDIVKDFFKDKNIPGFVYKCEEGWVGFGWNRDHLLQKCQSTDHGCDWIIKMDCDETLEVEDDFDWSVFDDKNLHSYHVTAIQSGTLYQRAWIWNARLKWKFNHDTAHETIELLTENIGSNFRRHNLPMSFRHIGHFSDGESWKVPTKYVSDALKLEEKLIRENTMFSDLYHFWYIGKSYYDGFREKALPLKEVHSREMARRCIFNFTEFINYTHNFNQTGRADRLDEMAYYAMMLIGNCYSYLNQDDQAIYFLEKAEEFCPPRNEHLINLALVYQKLGNYEKMLTVTEKLNDPARKNPFPEFSFIIDANSYYDTGNYVQSLLNEALSHTKPSIFKVSRNMKKRLWVVDNFYENPDEVRKFALGVEYQEDNQWYKGLRSKEQYLFQGLKEALESVMGMKLKPLESHGMCGRFQICRSQEQIVYHNDSQNYAAMIYLTPNAPVESGTMLLKSKISGARHESDPNFESSFTGGYYDKTKFEVVDNVGNIYNRLLIMDSKCIHAASQYFGTNKEDSRLTHLFFFDNE